MVSDRIPDRKVATIAASLVAAAATANGSIDEKERELNEVITGLQILREELIRRVSVTHLTIFVRFPIKFHIFNDAFDKFKHLYFRYLACYLLLLHY